MNNTTPYTFTERKISKDEILNAYNVKEEDGYPCESSYEPIINLIGATIASRDDDDYQGDSYRIVWYPTDGFGYLEFGWGSCSGCDALQGCYSYDEITELANTLIGSVKWFTTKEELVDYFKTKDWELEYLTDEKREFIDVVINNLIIKENNCSETVPVVCNTQVDGDINVGVASKIVEITSKEKDCLVNFYVIESNKDNDVFSEEFTNSLGIIKGDIYEAVYKFCDKFIVINNWSEWNVKEAINMVLDYKVTNDIDGPIFFVVGYSIPLANYYIGQLAEEGFMTADQLVYLDNNYVIVKTTKKVYNLMNMAHYKKEIEFLDSNTN